MTKKSVLLVLVLLASVIGPLDARQANGQMYGEIVLTAVDATTGATLPGACYLISDLSFCDDDYVGVVWITEVPPGEYIISEWLAPTGYELVAPFSIFVDPAFPAGSNVLVQHFPLAGGEAPVAQQIPQQIPAPAPSTSIEFYESPSWGYIFSWDPSKWSVTDRSTNAGVDRLAIAGPAGTVELLGGQAYGGNPVTCLTAAEQNMWTEPGVVNVRGAIDEGNNGFSSQTDWYSENTFQVDYANGQAQVRGISCYPLIPGTGVLRVTTVASFEQVDQLWDDLDGISRKTAFPRRSFTGIDTSDGSLIGPYLGEGGCTNRPDPPRPLRNSAAAEIGMATWYKWTSLSSQSTAVLIFENTSAADLIFDALQFQLVVRGDTTKSDLNAFPVAQFEWLRANGSDSVQSITPGSRAILRLAFQYSAVPERNPALEIRYAVLGPESNPVASLTPLGCGAGGGRGKPIRQT